MEGLYESAEGTKELWSRGLFRGQGSGMFYSNELSIFLAFNFDPSIFPTS